MRIICPDRRNLPSAPAKPSDVPFERADLVYLCAQTARQARPTGPQSQPYVTAAPPPGYGEPQPAQRETRTCLQFDLSEAAFED